MKLFELQETNEKKQREFYNAMLESVTNELKTLLPNDEFKILRFEEKEECYHVYYSFTLDGYLQEDMILWQRYECHTKLAEHIQKHISYIKELRNKYPDSCKAMCQGKKLKK